MTPTVERQAQHQKASELMSEGLKWMDNANREQLNAPNEISSWLKWLEDYKVRFGSHYGI